MNNVVLDSSALLALIANEKGADVVTHYLSNAKMSTVNISESIATLINKGATFQEAETIVDSLLHDRISFSDTHSKIAAEIVTETKKYGLSLGDRACLSLAIAEKLPVLTADKIWSNLIVRNYVTPSRMINFPEISHA